MAAPHTVVLDIETKNPISDGFDIDKLEPSVVGIWSSRDDFRAYFENELDELWLLLESADLVVGFNIKHFDMPVLAKFYRGNINSLPVLDLLEDVQKQLGYRLKLDHLVEQNLGQKKIADGLQAIEFYKNGEIEKLKKYCLDDVRLTKELYEHGLAHGKLKYIDRYRGESELAVTWKPLENIEPVNLTLPF